jgi:hypothetical protein
MTEGRYVGLQAACLYFLATTDRKPVEGGARASA